MSIIKIIIISIFFNLYSFAQPGVKPNVTVDIQTIFLDGKQIFTKGNGTIVNNTIYLSKRKGQKDVYTNTVGKLDDS